VSDGGNPSAVVLWNPGLFLMVSVGTLAVIFFGSSYKTMALSAGGSAVAESLGGRPVLSNTIDPDERKLLNVVEEMSIASGVPMPKVYVLPDEDGINAFAAGHTPSDAAVTVTAGCLRRLNRDELQGVIGHEFSHILNGDMRLNIRLIGILFGIFCIATIGRILLQARGSGRDRNALPLVGLLLLAVGAVGVFFGRLIQAAVSRQREFLADASSVQFTRNPGGLSGALQKIGGFGSVMESPHAADASHLFFASGFSSAFFEPMATHPPLPDRIRAIDPAWDGKFRRVEEEEVEGEVTLRRPPLAQPSGLPRVPNMPGMVIAGAVLESGAAAPPVIKSNSVLPNLGNPSPLLLKYAEELRSALPDSLRLAVREPLDATAAIYALLLSAEDALRAKQIGELANRVSSSVAEKTGNLYPDALQAANHARLPLVNLALPALRQLDAVQYRQFNDALEWLIDSDGQVELFEFVLQKIVRRHLEPHFNGTHRTAVQYYTLKPLVPDCALILSALANVSSSNPAEVAKAFQVGAPFLYAPENSGLALLPTDQCGLDRLGAALDRLAVAVPYIKKNLIQACAEVVGADGVIQESEAELLRAIADTMDCPIPPLGVTE
jgi:Zn-dependent protease with chaperone function